MEENVIRSRGWGAQGGAWTSIAVAAWLCIGGGCRSAPPNADDLARIFELRDRRELGDGYLVRLLAHPDAELRRQAALAIGANQTTPGIAPLTRVAREDAEPFVRRAAVFALGQLPGPDRGHLLEPLLADQDESFRACGVSAVCDKREIAFL